jgi:hypothetical protein
MGKKEISETTEKDFVRLLTDAMASGFELERNDVGRDDAGKPYYKAWLTKGVKDVTL